MSNIPDKPVKSTVPTFQLTKKKPVDVLRSSPGSRVNGHWVEGATTTVTIEANVQPLKFQELQMLPEADRSRKWIKLFSVDPLYTVQEGTPQTEADIVLWEGDRYIVSKVRHFSMSILDHYETQAVAESKSAL